MKDRPAIDTNVVVQFLTHDDKAQWPRAEGLVQRGVSLSETVLLESEWVLRAVYGLSTKAIGEAFEKLAQVKTLTLERRECVVEALRLYRAGLDFADAIHIATTASASFRTFDKQCVKRAKKAGTKVTVEGV